MNRPPPTTTPLTPEMIAERLRLASTVREDPNPNPQEELRRASVLAPLFRENGDKRSPWRLLLIRRTDQVSHHKGQIAFPGGRWEPDDADDRATALRETHEELGLPPSAIRVLGPLPRRVTVNTGFLIQPFVGVVQPPLALVPDPREVAETLTVELDFFLDPAHHVTETFTGIPGIHHRYHYGERVIWGATAAIIHRFVKLIMPGPSPRAPFLQPNERADAIS